MATYEQISEIFGRLASEAIEEHRVGTITPFNPYGDGSLDTLCWNGSLRECWEAQEWSELADEINEAREEDGFDPLDWDDWEGNEAEIEGAALALPGVDVVGTGRPIYVAFCDGSYPTVYCESATLEEVETSAAPYFGHED